jgi:hypothetical protein
VNEEVTGILEVGIDAANVLKCRVFDPSRVVLDPEFYLQHLQHVVAAEVAGRVVVGLRRIDEAIPVASDLEFRLSSGVVEPVETLGNIESFCAGQARSTNQIQSANVQPLKESVWIRTKFRQRWEARSSHCFGLREREQAQLSDCPRKKASPASKRLYRTSTKVN